jgi:hypothetical protein
MVRSRTVGLVAVVIAAVFLAGTTTLAAGVSPTSLTTAERDAVRHAPHPYVRSQCDRGVAVLFARRTTVGARHVIIAQVECRGSTSGAPVETAVYGRRDQKWHQLYRLDSGRSRQRRPYSIAASETFRVHGRRLVLPYQGYRATDPLCCASRTYHRVFHLAWTSFTRGKLIRDS